MKTENEMIEIPTWMFKFAAWVMGGVGVVSISIMMFAMQINTRLSVIESQVSGYNQVIQEVKQLSQTTDRLEYDVEQLKNKATK